jgi:hypothetical protein
MMLSTVIVQTTPESQPSTPGWMGEVAAFAQVLNQTGILTAIQERVRFARARMGTYELIDFVIVLIGYALSGEPTLRAFYDRLFPRASAFMALFGRSRLPSRSALSRFLAALDQASMESLRTLFQEDLLARAPFADPGGIRDRCEQSWLVTDVDGTRKAARQRALPQSEALPAPHRRFDRVCAKGYQGRKRGEVVRTRTVVLQAHTHQFLGTFGGAGNGDYRGELLRATQVLIGYAKQLEIPPSRILIRLDGLYGNAAPLSDVLSSGLGLIARSKDYQLLDLAQVQAVLAGPPAQTCIHPESQTSRALFDCPLVPLSAAGPSVRLIVAASPAMSAPPSVGEQRAETVYELFVSTLPSPAFTAKDVLDLYLHRGSFETVLADEDGEQDADRWVSHTACGQEGFQILAQWIWNLRLELGQHLAPAVRRTTEFAPAQTVSPVCENSPAPESPPVSAVVYGPPHWAGRSFTGGFPGSAFTLQPDGTLHCPADRPLYPQERRPERDGSLRVLYAGRIGHCRACPLREQCQEHPSTKKPRRVSAVFWPITPVSLSAPPPSLPPPSALFPSAPLLWRDWPRRHLRRHWLQLIRRETATLVWEPANVLTPPPGHSAWLAMPVLLTLPGFVSSCMVSPLASSRPSVPLTKRSRKQSLSTSNTNLSYTCHPGRGFFIDDRLCIALARLFFWMPTSSHAIS